MMARAGLVGIAFLGAVVLRLSCLAGAASYVPVDGGFQIVDGAAEFTRPLHGSHVQDNAQSPSKNLMWTGDRPRIQLGHYQGNACPPLRDDGILEFGKGLKGITFRYVEGRAEYDFSGRGSVALVRSADSDGLIAEVKGGIPYEMSGLWKLLASERTGEAEYLHFGRADERPAQGVASAFAAGKERLRDIANAVRVRTPDKAFDAFITCMNVCADAMFEEGLVTHAAGSYHVVLAGWRGLYLPVLLGRDEVVKSNAKAFFSAQKADGRIPSTPWADQPYNMCEVFVDSLMLYWDRTGDVGFFRDGAYDAVKRHLGWMETAMKVPGANLYENFLDAWNTDNKWCNGGAGTIASAYTYRAYRTMSEIARKLGKGTDSALFAQRAAAIRADANRLLFDEQAGTWCEYRERFGATRMIACPDTSSIYTPIDMGLSDCGRSVSSLLWAERNIPSAIRDGVAILYSSNKPPEFWTTCGVYQSETADFAHAWFLAGEPEMGWRHFRDSIVPSVCGPKSGPGMPFVDMTNINAPRYEEPADTTAVMLRTTVEGVFGIHMDAGNGRVRIVPGFPASWDNASIETPYLSYTWTRKGGVKVTGNPLSLKVFVEIPRPKMVGAAMPKPHRNWGHPNGEGTNCRIAPGRQPCPVAIDGVFNRNLRTLHEGTFGPRISMFPWDSWLIGRTLMANGRSWWEWHTSGRQPKFAVPQKLDWPADGVVRSPSGLEFHLGAGEGMNGAFTALYEELPDAITVKVSGKASKVAFLTVLSTNPNLSWSDAARITVRYADGGSKTLNLRPPDNCDDWLNYSTGKPYHLTGEHIMFGSRAHGNVLSIDVDPARELAAIEFKCIGTETIAGLLAVTLYQ